MLSRIIAISLLTAAIPATRAISAPPDSAVTATEETRGDSTLVFRYGIVYERG